VELALPRSEEMLLRLLATLFFAVAVAVVLVRRPVKRANAWGGAFGGMLLIALGISESRGHTASRVFEVLLLQMNARDLRGVIADFWVMLGYGFMLGAIAAMPWLARSSASEVGNVLRRSLSFRNSWRESLIRHFRWLLVMAVILLLWRWVGGIYYR
jgi:hypothetical protein